MGPTERDKIVHVVEKQRNKKRNTETIQKKTTKNGSGEKVKADVSIIFCRLNLHYFLLISMVDSIWDISCQADF